MAFFSRTIGAVLATLLAAPASAEDAAPSPGCAPAGVTLTLAARACSYGLPVIYEGLVLIPKSCRLELAGKPIDRHSVEVRTVTNGSRIGQASLPPQPASGSQPPDPGAILAGTPPLLVLGAGIAAIDGRKGSADLVFEAQGVLLGAARTGDLLALAERLPPDKSGKAKIEWTILDLEAGALVGEATTSGTAIAGMSLVRSATGVRASLDLGSDATSVHIEAQVLDATGKSVVKDGQLAVVAGPKPARAVPTGAIGCPVIAASTSVVVARMAAVRPDATRLPPSVANQPWRSPEACVAIIETPGHQRLAWLRNATGDLQLVSVSCTQASAPPAAKKLHL